MESPGDPPPGGSTSRSGIFQTNVVSGPVDRCGQPVTGTATDGCHIGDRRRFCADRDYDHDNHRWPARAMGDAGRRGGAVPLVTTTGVHDKANYQDGGRTGTNWTGLSVPRCSVLPRRVGGCAPAPHRRPRRRDSRRAGRRGVRVCIKPSTNRRRRAPKLCDVPPSS
jgi:hypothetical protein